MCLFVNNLNFKTAEEDIVCYKVLEEINYKIITPYMGEEVCFNTIIIPKDKIFTKYFLKGFFLKLLIILKRYYFYHSRLLTNWYKVFHISYSKLTHKFIIEEGVIHLYTDKKFCCCEYSSSFMCKAIIPKGTKYIVSSDGTEIGALKVIYKKL